MSNTEWIKSGIGLLQAIISGVFVGLVIYWLDERRAKRDRRLSDFRIASNWFQSETKVSLRNFDLSNTNLAGHKFMEANLEDALFVNADVWATNFTEANLRNANFRKARLIGTKLIKAIARGADFSNTVINKKSYPDYVHLPDFTGAELQRCKFIGAHLDGVPMVGSKLNRSDFSKATVINCDFTNADLAGSKWKKVKRVDNCIWKGVIVDNQEDFQADLWKEIQKQNAQPKKKRKTEK